MRSNLMRMRRRNNNGNNNGNNNRNNNMKGTRYRYFSYEINKEMLELARVLSQ